MIPYEKWEVIHRDNEIDGRRAPRDPEEYGMNILGTEKYLLFPRGMLKDVAMGTIIHGRAVLANLFSRHLTEKDFFERTSLNYDSLIAVATKMHHSEEMRFQEYLIEELNQKLRQRTPRGSERL